MCAHKQVGSIHYFGHGLKERKRGVRNAFPEADYIIYALQTVYPTDPRLPPYQE